jgi:BirA family biotin operon repressor/biotin-[acetyl-CoA-carboxylase] ligase
VYASADLRPHLPPGALGSLALVVSLGVARGLERFGVAAGLKWPNDVVIGGGKVAGVLMELAAEADTVEWLVVGCGINVATPVHAGAASVRAVAPGAGVADVAAAVLDEIAAAYRSFLTDGFDPVADEYRQRGTLWGREVVVRDAYGVTVAAGTAETVDGTGALVVRDTEGAHAVVAGEVTLAG